MLQRESTSARPPLATRQRLNNMSIDAALPSAKLSWVQEINLSSLGAAENGYLEHEEDVKEMKALENASRLLECSWNDCDAVLGSWELLRRHVEKMHCQAFSRETLGKASSSRPYRCRYATCLNRIYADPSQLLEHIVMAHLDSLKLRCPLGCKQPMARLQAMMQHLSSVHRKTITELPGARMHLPPPRRVPLPDLPTRTPMALECVQQVKPYATFNLARAKPQPGVDPWDDFAELDEEETKSFARLGLPPNGHVADEMRPIPRGRAVYDGIRKPEAKVAQTLDETVGYETWKQRFERETAEAGAAEQVEPARIRQKS